MTDLTDRMRTCAAYLCGAAKAGDGSLRDYGQAIIDAADLLIEASNALESHEPNTPMEIIEPAVSGVARPDPETMKPISPAVWVSGGDTLSKANPYRSANTCPKCDSRASKKVYRQGNSLVLECSVCGHAWKRT